jgi:SAM-dependent methyltransferase
MNVFEAYSEYYDLLYTDKRYDLEANYVQSLISENISSDRLDLLNLGCGTGKHDFEFEKFGYNIVGVDLSTEMIDIANKHKPLNSSSEFIVSDIKTLNLDKEFDVVTSLFHVINYQNSNKDLELTFDAVSKHLKKGGIFIFDFWNGPGVLTDLPKIKSKNIENSKISVERSTVPNFKFDKNIVEVNFGINIKSKHTGEVKDIAESHSMRYLFQPEIALFAKDFTIIDTYEWFTRNPLTNQWYGVVIMRKN